MNVFKNKDLCYTHLVATERHSLCFQKIGSQADFGMTQISRRKLIVGLIRTQIGSYFCSRHAFSILFNSLIQNFKSTYLIKQTFESRRIRNLEICPRRAGSKTSTKQNKKLSQFFSTESCKKMTQFIVTLNHIRNLFRFSENCRPNFGRYPLHRPLNQITAHNWTCSK